MVVDEGMTARTEVHKNPSHSWWFDSHSGSRRSPWLLATLSELEEKTKGMLRLVEEDADSFAKRAEMYYKKRPELMAMIEDFYRAHRSLAERYDQLKFEGGLFRSTSFDSSLTRKIPLQKSRSSVLGSSKSSSSESEDSEVDDPEPELEVEVGSGETSSREEERLRKENAALRAELAVKDEEKREVIRQLSMAFNILKEENHSLRSCIIKDSKKWGGFLDFMRVKKGVLCGKLFGGLLKHQNTMVAL